jgi:PAS domain S-box-containing protein
MTALQESEERGRLVLDTVLDAVVTIDTHGLVTSWNREAQNTFGWTSQETIGQSLSSTIIPPRYRDAHERGLRHFLATQEGPVLNQRIEITALHRDGREFLVELAITAVRRGDNPIFSAFIRDISERTRAEAALRASEERFRQLAENVSEVFWMCNKDLTQVLYVSPAYEKVWGRSCQSLYDQPRSFAEAVHPADRDHLSTMLAEQKRGQETEKEYRILRPDGAVALIRDRSFPIRNEAGEFYRIAGVAEDITERKRAEERMRQSEANLAAAQKMVHLGSWEVDLVDLEDVGRNPLHWSDEVFRIFGYEPGQLDISRENFLLMVHPEDRLHVSEAAAAALHEKRPYDLVHRIALPNGVVRVVHEHAEMTYDERTGRPLRMVGTVQDITERKRSEKELRDSEQRFRELNATLEQRVLERTTELSQAKTSLEAEIIERKRYEQSLQKANRMKSQFLANMSHELRTPLNGIIGFAEFLVDGKPGLLNPKQKEYLGDILNSGQHLLQLINDVLDLAKVESGKMELNLETFALSKAIEEVCAVAKAIAQKKNIQIHTAFASDLVQVTLDQQKFKQVLYNLLSNAVKFTDEGGKVEILTARRDAHYFKLVVKDTGIGIKPEDINRLFTEFEQLDSGASRRHEGTGLGLALTRKLLELHGGSIEVESETDRGSTFTVTLPMSVKELEA